MVVKPELDGFSPVMGNATPIVVCGIGWAEADGDAAATAGDVKLLEIGEGSTA